MAFTSLADARTKITDPRSEVDSIILYGSDNKLNTNTLFYTDAAKTLIAPAGNYVIATNYKSYYITLGSNGKMTGSPTEVMQGTDISWVDDELHSRYGENGRVNNWVNIGGTDLVLSNDLKLTDNVWTSRPYDNPKRWIIENTTIQTTPITDIDLSDMKGYDLRLVTGEWKNSGAGIPGFHGHTTSAIIHLAPDPDRQDVVGNIKYFFRPDYWIPHRLHDGPSYFRRMPNIIPLKDKYGREKSWYDAYTGLADLKYTATGYDRPSTRFNKGFTESQVFSWKAIVPNPYPDGSRKENWFTVQPKKLNFDGDNMFKHCVGVAWNTNPDTIPMGDSMWHARTVALFESLLITDEGERATKTWNINGYTYTYAQANPYKWTTERNSGIAYTSDCPASQMEGYFYYVDGSANGKRFEYDFEYVGIVGAYSYNAGLAWAQCFTSAKNAIYPTEGPKGALIPKFSLYGLGIYDSSVQGQAGEGWLYAKPGESLSNFAPLYSNYHDYYINGTKSYSQVSGIKPWYLATIEYFRYSYITNYQNDMVSNYYVYAIVHNYDISRKIYDELLGTNNDVRICTYFWRNQEPLPASADNAVVRRAVRPDGSILQDSDSDKLEVCPSLMYNIALWGMAYADGVYFWDDAYIGEEKNIFLDYRNDAQDATAITNIYGYFGDCITNGKSTVDWPYIANFLLAQNKDIIEANTDWLVPDLSLGNDSWTTGTANYPVMLYNQSKPIARYKLSADGTEALLLIHSGFNIGYTKETHTLRLPAKNNYQVTVNTWGNFTSVIRIKNL